MNSVIEWIRKGLLLFLAGFLALTVVGVGMYFLVLKPGISKEIQKNDPAHELVKAPKGEDDHEDERSGASEYLVPAARVPKTQKARYDAPSVTLLSDRWQTDPSPKLGPDNDGAAIPIAERTKITTSLGSFLRRWETFTPPIYRQKEKSAPAAYGNSFRPWVAPEAFSTVIQRTDNQQPAEICPFYGCSVSSKWDQGSAVNGSNVRYYDGKQAYVTMYAGISYHDAIGQSEYNDTVWLRTYGVLMRRSGERWLVTRVAAGSRGILR